MEATTIRDLREHIGLSQQGLADRINGYSHHFAADRNIVSRWERRESVPSPLYRAALYRVRVEAHRAAGMADQASSIGPPGTSMDRHALAVLIREHGILEMTSAVNDKARMFVDGLVEGWDLIDWTVNTSAPGIVIFARYPRNATPVNPEVAHLREELSLLGEEDHQLHIAQSSVPDYCWDRREQVRRRRGEINQRFLEIDPDRISQELAHWRSLGAEFPGQPDRVAELETQLASFVRSGNEAIEGVVYIHTNDRTAYQDVIADSEFPLVALYPPGYA